MMGTCALVVLLIISGVCGIFALLAQLYMVGFIMDLGVPITVDRSPTWHNPPRLERWPILNNLLLLLLFFVQHSAMPRGPLKRIIRTCISEDYYRPLYSFIASGLILISFYLWVPINVVVWEVKLQTFRNAIYGADILCWIGLSVAMLALDPFSLLGIGDPLYQLLGWEHKVKLVKNGLYGWVRHPVYSFLIMSIWITPTMTIGHLLLSTMYTAYILIAVPFYEEPDLLKQLGSEYAEYMKSTPCYIPKIPFITKTKSV